ncbi:MAG TPA: hypothetical protein VL122_09815 [Nitrospirota bacterium]|nr:hypothetical protein [Nitrospirota bacterium]
MFYRLTGIVVTAFMLCYNCAAYGEDITKEELKGQDEQVQDIKSDVLSISAELEKLEEKLLYPSSTEVSVFVSLAAGETFRLDAVELQMDQNPVARHVYSFKELEAMRKGGVQRIYTGNIRTGDHDLVVSVMGKTGGGSDLRKTEHFKVSKDVAPTIVELSLSDQGITERSR